MVYQIWAVWRRPRSMRTRGVRTILGISILLNGLLVVSWVVISIRYR